jgi:hypothetical protein
VKTFKNLSSATSPTRQAAHQDANSTNYFPSPLGNQHNRDNFFLRREDLSRGILVATHLFQLTQNGFLTILAIYYF